jgi:hypothetical protein
MARPQLQFSTGQMLILADLVRAVANGRVTLRQIQELLNSCPDPTRHAPDDLIGSSEAIPIALRRANELYGDVLKPCDMWELVQELSSSGQIYVHHPGLTEAHTSIRRDQLHILVRETIDLARRRMGRSSHQ